MVHRNKYSINLCVSGAFLLEVWAQSGGCSLSTRRYYLLVGLSCLKVRELPVVWGQKFKRNHGLHIDFTRPGKHSSTVKCCLLIYFLKIV